MKMIYKETKKFVRDFKKLLRRFLSLKKDLKIVKQYQIELFHYKQIDSKGIFKIQGVGNSDQLIFYKLKKFQCKSLKGRGAKSGIRLIYVYFPDEKKIELIQIYFKGEGDNENRERIKDFLKNR